MAFWIIQLFDRSNKAPFSINQVNCRPQTNLFLLLTQWGIAFTIDVYWMFKFEIEFINLSFCVRVFFCTSSLHVRHMTFKLLIYFGNLWTHFHLALFRYSMRLLCTKHSSITMDRLYLDMFSVFTLMSLGFFPWHASPNPSNMSNSDEPIGN